MEKMTYVSAIAYVLAHAELPTEVAEKLTALSASISKRNASKSDKPTKKQTANEGVKTAIVEVMGKADKPMTITAIVKAMGVEELTNQRVSALVRQLIADGVVVRTEEKRVAYFSLV